MGHHNREIERKLLVIGCTNRKKIDNLCRKIFFPKHIIQATRTDYFWKAPNVDFTRIRMMTSKFNGPGQMTVKKCDRNGSNFNRLEIDLDIGSVKQAIRLETARTGKKPKVITKRYSILFLDKRIKDYNISVYQVKDDKNVFIEVEGITPKQVKKAVRILRETLPYKLVTIKNSLYDMYVLGRGRP